MARSNVLRALLDSQWKEGSEEVIKIDDVRPEIFEVLLHYVYTDNIPEVHKHNKGADRDENADYFNVTFAQHLLAAADKYEL